MRFSYLSLILLSLATYGVCFAGCLWLAFTTKFIQSVPGFGTSRFYGPFLYPLLAVIGVACLLFFIGEDPSIVKLKKTAVFISASLLIPIIVLLLLTQVKSIRLFD